VFRQVLSHSFLLLFPGLWLLTPYSIANGWVSCHPPSGGFGGRLPMTARPL